MPNKNLKIAVLSGKGGTGKTFVSVNLAAAINDAIYIDCDVEEPNGRLFFKPYNNEKSTKESVFVNLPKANEDCDGCKKCVDFCRFNALAYIGNKLLVFDEVCHSCGGCMIVCPNNAITEQPNEVGNIEIGYSQDVKVVTGELNIGKAIAVPVIHKALTYGVKDLPVVIDCPPGSACSVMESIDDVDFCIIVVEPTKFGYHNYEMVRELVTLLNKPFGIIINKAYDGMEELYNDKILGKVMYSDKLATSLAKAEVAVRNDENLKQFFLDIYNKINEEVTLK